MVSKEHILSEIRRTAADNSGKTLGENRFFTVTGIKTSDWRGRYWARWSDAVREAGFEPNTMNSPLAEQHVLESVASLTKELGRFPTYAELTLATRSRDNFPSFSVIRRRGGLSALAVSLQKHFDDLGETALASLCAAATERLGRKNTSDDGGSSPEWGFVYLVKSGRNFKIGKTNSVGRRERELAIQLPDRATVVHSIKTDDPSGIEAYWHTRFGDRRKNGEWFELSPQDVAAFRRRKFM